MKQCTNCGVTPTNTMLTDGLCVVCHLARQNDGLRAQRDERLTQIEILTRATECIKNLTAERDDWRDAAGRHYANGVKMARENERLRAQVPVWISVDERLPDSESFVTVYNRSLGCVMSAIHFDVWTDNGGFSCDDGDITHWMPLPEPPESEAL